MSGWIIRAPIFQNEDVVFGPGLVNAHDLEKEVAKSMRCVVSSDIAGDEAVQEYLSHDGCALVVDPEDGRFLIDFVRPNNRDRLSAITSQVLDSGADEELKEKKEKYGWLRRYIDRAAGA